MANYRFKECVVEIDYCRLASVVVGERRIVGKSHEIFSQLISQETWVAIPESIYRLFLVADDEIAVSIVTTLLKQRFEVLVLLAAGVLKLVNHIIVKFGPSMFVNKACSTVKDLFDEFIGVGN